MNLGIQKTFEHRILLAGSCQKKTADGGTGIAERREQAVSDETGAKNDGIPFRAGSSSLFSHPRDQTAVPQKVICETPAIRSVAKESSDTFIQGIGRKAPNLAGYLWDGKHIHLRFILLQTAFYGF